MKITSIETEAIRAGEMDILSLIDHYVEDLPEHSILAVTSKIVSLCEEGRSIPVGSADVQELARQEAQYYLAPEPGIDYALTINRNILISKAGIDVSNTDGHYVLWPKDPQASANMIREHLVTRFGKQIGVMITDARVTPMRRGVIGVGLSHSGFLGLHDYVGTPDIFGNYRLKYTRSSILDGLAAAVVVQMGEGDNRTPLAVIEEVDFVEFQDRNPTSDELAAINMPLDEDLYAEMLKKIPWHKRP